MAQDSSLSSSSLVSLPLLPSQPPRHNCTSTSVLSHLALPHLCFRLGAWPRQAGPCPQSWVTPGPTSTPAFPQHRNFHLPVSSYILAQETCKHKSLNSQGNVGCNRITGSQLSSFVGKGHGREIGE